MFPPGTPVKLMGLKAAILNGKCGVVVEASAARRGKWYAGLGVGKVSVRMDGNGREQAIAFENLQNLRTILTSPQPTERMHLTELPEGTEV